MVTCYIPTPQRTKGSRPFGGVHTRIFRSQTQTPTKCLVTRLGKSTCPSPSPRPSTHVNTKTNKHTLLVIGEVFSGFRHPHNIMLSNTIRLAMGNHSGKSCTGVPTKLSCLTLPERSFRGISHGFRYHITVSLEATCLPN